MEKRMITTRERILLDNIKLIEVELKRECRQDLLAMRDRLVVLLNREIDRNNKLTPKAA